MLPDWAGRGARAGLSRLAWRQCPYKGMEQHSGTHVTSKSQDRLFLTITEAGEILGISRNSAYAAARLCRESDGADGLPNVTIAGIYRVRDCGFACATGDSFRPTPTRRGPTDHPVAHSMRQSRIRQRRAAKRSDMDPLVPIENGYWSIANF